MTIHIPIWETLTSKQWIFSTRTLAISPTVKWLASNKHTCKDNAISLTALKSSYLKIHKVNTLNITKYNWHGKWCIRSWQNLKQKKHVVIFTALLATISSELHCAVINELQFISMPIFLKAAIKKTICR